MQIFVDADACPVVGIVERAAKEHNLPVILPLSGLQVENLHMESPH